MKCPKCGNTNLTIERRPNGGTICNICLFSGKATEFNKELSTAEKLLWLVENNLERYPLIDEQGDACVGGVLFIHLATDEYGKDRCIEYTDTLQLHEAVSTLYEWAKDYQTK